MKKPHAIQRRQRERGVVLLFCLIILVILLAGGVAVMRSMNTSLFTAGNLAFKRDLVNQGEQALTTVLAQFKAGGALASATTDAPTLNYKASTLAANAQGVPTALLTDSAFSAVGSTSNDITGSTGVKIRYLIERMCNAAGAPTSTNCVQTAAAPTGGTGGPEPPPAPPTATVYRVTVRVTGPRDTQVFLQTSLTKPD
jgi:type IV pilus assembly protein PilX